MLGLVEFLEEAKERARLYGFNGNHRAYIQEPGFEALYVRYCTRNVNGVRYSNTFDIANVAVEEDIRGTGVFTRFVEKLRREYPSMNLYVENALHPRFQRGLLKMGFIPVQNLDACFFMEGDSQCPVTNEMHARS